MRVLGPDVDNTTPPPQKHRHTTTSPPIPPHHHNLAKHRIVLVLGPDASTCLLSCRLKGRETTDQNIFVISELLMRIITHHISSTYIPSASSWHVGYKGSWYHGPEHLWYQRVVDENYHTSHILHIYTSQQHISTTSLSEDVSGRKILDRRTPKGTQISTKLDISSWAGCFRKGRDTTDSAEHLCSTYTHLKQHQTTTPPQRITKVQNTDKCEFSGWMLTPPHHHHKNTTTSPHHTHTTTSPQSCDEFSGRMPQHVCYVCYHVG